MEQQDRKWIPKNFALEKKTESVPMLSNQLWMFWWPLSPKILNFFKPVAAYTEELQLNDIACICIKIDLLNSRAA